MEPETATISTPPAPAATPAVKDPETTKRRVIRWSRVLIGVAAMILIMMTWSDADDARNMAITGEANAIQYLAAAMGPLIDLITIIGLAIAAYIFTRAIE